MKKKIVVRDLVEENRKLQDAFKQRLNEDPFGKTKDIFTAEYNGQKLKIDGKFLKPGEEAKLLQQLKKFNLGSGHEEMKLSKIDDDNFTFRLETYNGGPIQKIYFERIK